MDRVRFWGPRVMGKYWAPLSAGAALGEAMYNDAYARVDKWASERGMKRKRGRRDPIPPRLKQDTLRLPALSANSNNKMSRSRGRSRSRMTNGSRSRSRGPSIGPSVYPSMPPLSVNVGKPGNYTGPLPFPKKKARVQRDRVALYGSKGQAEQNFTVEHTDVTYAGFTSMIRKPTDSSFNPGAAPYHVAMALLRHIFKKHLNVDIESHSQTLAELVPVYLRGSDGGAANDILDLAQIQFWFREDPATAGGNPTFNIGYQMNLNAAKFSSSMANLAEEIARQVICSSAFGARDGYTVSGTAFNVPRRQLYSYRVQNYLDWMGYTGTGGTTATRWSQHYRLDHFKVDVRTDSIIYLQNQTTSDAGSTAIDTVDTNPVKGRIMYFDHPNPIVRFAAQNQNSTSGMMAICQDVNQDGIIYPNFTAYPLANMWKQIPVPDMFKNMKTYSDVSLAPGEMKRMNIRFKFSGYLHKFIHGLRLNPGIRSGTEWDGTTTETGTNYTQMMDEDSGAMGTCVLFAFEKRLSTGNGGPKITFQRNTYCSAVLSKGKKPTCMRIAYPEVAVVND